MHPTKTRLFGLACGITATSGAAALAHELLWTRRLVDLLGGSSDSTARVFGCFFLGLAMGTASARFVIDRVRCPWRAVGLTELLLAVAVIPALTLNTWTSWLWPSLGPVHLVAWPGRVVKWCLSFAVVVPPAFFMGLALPLLVQALLVERGRLCREGIYLYALNTAGGVVGLAVTGGVLLARCGVWGSMWLAMAVNLALGVICLAISTGQSVKLPFDEGRETRSPETVAESVGSTPRCVLRWQFALVIAFLSGAVMLGAEILTLHLCGQIFVSSLQTTTSVLAVVIFALAGAALAAPWLARRLGGAGEALVAALTLAAMTMALAPLSLMRWTDQLQPAAAAGSIWHFLAQVTGTVMLSVGPALWFGGFVFPLTLVWLDQSWPHTAGRQWPWLLAANGVGGLMGAELTGAVLMPMFGLHRGMGGLAIVYAVLAVAIWLGLMRSSHSRLLTTLCLAALVGTSAAWTFWLDRLPQLSPAHEYRAIATLTSREGVLSVVTPKSRSAGTATAPRALVLNNQYVLGGTLATEKERRQSLLPLLLHGHPRRVACIGLATGITAGAGLALPQVESLTAVEISRPVMRAACAYFADQNRGICGAARALVVIEDGRTFLAACNDRFDVVVGDLYRPWGAGEGRLLSREHFAAVRRSLRRGGLFCQWLPMYQLDEHQFQVVLDTFADVFGPVDMFRLDFGSEQPIVGLCGWRDGQFDFATLARRVPPPGISDPVLQDAAAVALLYMGVYTRLAERTGPLNTLDNLWLELDAGRKKLLAGGAHAYLYGSRWQSFEKRLLKKLNRPQQQRQVD